MAKNDPVKGEVEVTPPFPKLIEVSQDEAAVLRAVLYRDFSSKLAHGGLGPLLSLAPSETAVLIAFLNRI